MSLGNRKPQPRVSGMYKSFIFVFVFAFYFFFISNRTGECTPKRIVCNTLDIYSLFQQGLIINICFVLLLHYIWLKNIIFSPMSMTAIL